MAVIRHEARGAAQKPGGASRRHAQAVLYFQEGIQEKFMTIQLRHETPDDVAVIEAVTVAAFAHAPHTSHTEQFIVRALRAAGELTLSIVAEEHGQAIGHVALSPVTVTDGHGHGHGHKAEGWYGLGPISVLPQWQGQGIGSRLMQQALAKLRAMHAAGCVPMRACNYRACRPATSWHWPSMGLCPKASRTTAMPSTPPPEPVRRRRRSDSVGLEHRARPQPRPDLLFTAPRSEQPGRGAGHSFVSMSHHTARGKARPVMG